MFSPGSLDKNSSTLPESSSPGRSKFAIGINPLGEESQQNIRIQLAVQGYNNSTGSSFFRPVNERSSPSFKQAFFKYLDNEKKDTQNSVKKTHNQYQGIGNFPVVHLKKNTIYKKPVRRNTTNEFKIQLPELPFNRYLNQSPDVCLDTKTSTRSVLDVLQYLSRKRIHTKDDTEASKRKCKGLGGDAPLNIEAPYKPLFVPKSKAATVTLRDSTTQTHDIPPLDTIQTKKIETLTTNDKDDPKAELRRRLARQNNEIFASLSSSTLSYPIKRNSDKISRGKDVSKQDEHKAKKGKFIEEKSDKGMQNGCVSPKDVTTINSSDQSGKIEKKQKVEGNKISPNKDRLTTIFLEMQNINPKVEVLGKSQNTVSKKDGSTDAPAAVNTSTGKYAVEDSFSTDKVDSSASTGVTLTKAKETNPAGSSVVLDSAKNETKVTEANTQSSVLNPTGSGENTAQSTKAISPGFFTFGTGTVQTQGTSPEKTEAPKTIPPGFFKFGADSQTQNPPVTQEAKTDNNVTSSPVTVSGSAFTLPSTSTSVTSAANGFSSTVTSSVSQSPFTISTVTTTTTTFTQNQQNPPLFTFSDKTLSGNQPTEKPPTFSFGFNASSTNTSTIPVFGASSNTAMVPTSTPDDKAVNGEKPQEKPDVSTEKSDTIATTSTTFQTTFPTSSTTTTLPSTFLTTSFSTAPAFGQTTTPQTTQGVVPFKFGEKTDTQKSSTESTFSAGNNNLFDQKSKPGLFTFGNKETPVFGQKPPETPAFGQKPPETPAFGQKPPETPAFGQKPPETPAFGQKPPETPAFGQKPSETPVFGQKPQETPAFGQKPQETPTFGQKPQETSTFGIKPAVSQSNVFQSNVFSFGQKSATPTVVSQSSEQMSVFGQKPVTQTSLIQQSSVSQTSTTSSFGTTTTSTGNPAINNTFTQNKTSVLPFGQPAPTFGQTSASTFSGETNIFGGSSSQNPPPAFGSSTQSSPFTFGSNANKQPNASGQGSSFFMQPSTGFGSTTLGQNSSTDNSLFGQKNNNQMGGLPFDNQNVQTFGQGPSTSQTFGSQAPFTFGATSSSSGFTMTPATASSSVFTFGGAPKTTTSSASSFSFNTSQSSGTTPSPFTFNSQANNNAFKFGGTATKETPTFGSGNNNAAASPFSATPSTSEASKPGPSGFNFRTPQSSTSSTGFNFGASPLNVFSFGGSNTSTSSPTFSFGGAQPNAGLFTPGVTPSPLQGKFSIGAAPNQPRSRNTGTRARRRT